MEQFSKTDSKKKAVNSANDMQKAHNAEVLVIEEDEHGETVYIVILNPEEYFRDNENTNFLFKKLQLQHIFKSYKVVCKC